MHSKEKFRYIGVPYRHGVARPQVADGGNDWDRWGDQWIGCSRKLHNVEILNLGHSFRIVKLKSMSWVLFVTCVKGEKCRFWTKHWRDQRGKYKCWWLDYILNWALNACSRMMWTKFIWLKAGTNGDFLLTWKWPFKFHKILGNSWVSDKILPSSERISSRTSLGRLGSNWTQSNTKPWMRNKYRIISIGS
jgi:hypothetical protein